MCFYYTGEIKGKTMSLLHRIIFHVLMKNRPFYDPKSPKDYEAARMSEIKATARIKTPANVTVRDGDLGGVPAQWISGKGNREDGIALYIHGGGFVTGSSAARKGFTFYVAGKLGLNVVSIDYRLAPEYPFPQGAEDCLTAYSALLSHYTADKIVLLGESAGGNLVLSLLLQIKEKNYPLPAAVFALSPTVQYDRVLDSYRDNLSTDCIVANLSDEVCAVYLRSRDKKVIKNPVAAPYYGDFSGRTPIELWVSDSEVLRDDSYILFEKLKEQQVPAKLYVRSGMMHTWLVIPEFPESKKDLKILGEEMHLALDRAFRPLEDPIRLE